VEDEFPVLAKHLELIAKKEHPLIKALDTTDKVTTYIFHKRAPDGRNYGKRVPRWGSTTERNAPCPCGSERKFKVCCGR